MAGTVVVTGASGGIGTAVVRALTGRGDRVFAIGRSVERLAGSGVVPVVMDLAEAVVVPDELAGLARIDALVHCAGIADIASVQESVPELWQRMFAVNLTSAAELTRRLLPALRAARGAVVFVNLAPGMGAVPGWSAYVGSKAALAALADSLRIEERPNGVRVTTIYPAGVATDLLAQVRAGFGREYDPAECIQPDTLASFVVGVIDTPADAYVSELSVLPTPRVQA
jgi:NADP-dependent 3-hydroxy acid dehydrogenase YdfG